MSQWAPISKSEMLYTSGLVSFKEGLMLVPNKLFVKQVKSFYLFLDQDPFIVLCSLHNIKYIKFTSPHIISISITQLSHSLLSSNIILSRVEFIFIFSVSPHIQSFSKDPGILQELRAQGSQGIFYS